MKILVTGGCGFIGSNFVRYWLSQHHDNQVINFDALTYAGHPESLKDIENNPNYTFIHGDITNDEQVNAALEGVDIVVHFAAESHVDRSVIDPLVFVKTNVVGTAVLLNAALKHNIKRFHHISTDEVFGDLSIDEPPFTETTPINPRSPYAASKASSDLLSLAYFKTYGLPVTVSNTSNNYGPYQDTEKFIPRFITNLLTDQKVPLMGKGENIRDWLFVDDHCRAIDLIIQKGTVGEKYGVGGNAEKTNLEVTKYLLQKLGKSEEMIEYVESRLGHDRRYAIENTKISELGWQPTEDFESGIDKTIEWYKQNEWWWKPLKEGRPNVDRTAQEKY